MNGDKEPFVGRWGQATDSEWLTVLIRACETDSIEGVTFPTLPTAEIQRTIQGNSNEIAVRGSFQFYRFVRDALKRKDIPLRHDGRFLDFGTGWGRILRPFMRDIPTRNIYAVEPSSEWALTARRCNPYVAILESDTEPPLQFRDGVFRWIVAYSIFTHLPEKLFDGWIHEFERLLEPGGIVAFTFLGKRTMDELAKYNRPIAPTDNLHFWHRILIEALDKYDPDGSRYLRNDFVFLPTGQTELFGDTFMHPSLVRSKLSARWNILEINSEELAQDVCIIQKPQSAQAPFHGRTDEQSH